MPSTADLAPEITKTRNDQHSDAHAKQEDTTSYESFQIMTDSKVSKSNGIEHSSVSRTESGSSAVTGDAEQQITNDLSKNPLVNSEDGAELDVLVKMERANK